MKAIVLKCPECRANLEIEEGYAHCYCKYCGNKIILDDDKAEWTYTKNININKTTSHTYRHIDDADVIRAKEEAANESRKSKNAMITVIACFLFMGLLYGAVYGIPVLQELSGKVSAGSYKELIGEDYKTVEAHFEAAGFTNIELIELNDSGILVWNKGKVKTISIGGNSTFSSYDYFDPDTKVVISYH